MKLVTETHNGICAHCRSDVPVDAIVCTGCGARWGFSNGLNRQQMYDLFKFQYLCGRVFAVGSLLTILYVYFIGTNDSGTNFNLMVGGFIILVFGVSAFV